LFGWRRADGKRRFRRAFLLAAKKSGKSPLMSALGLYLLLADGEKAPEIYICACDRDQAGIIYTESERMVRYSPVLQRKVEVIPSRKTILAGHGRLVANSSDSPKLDGLNASAILWDELHRQPDRMLWDVMEYAVAAREQPLSIGITTAGDDETGIWHEQLEYSLKVESGVIEDVTHLGIVYRAREEDDIDAVATWEKANPSLGVTFSLEDFRRDLNEAKTQPARLQNFKRLRLNIVCRAQARFLEMSDWDACGDPHLWQPPSDDRPCYMGLDLSTRDDLTALVVIAGDFASGFDTACRFWLPRENISRLEHQHGQPYRTWADEGLITLLPGNAIDYEFIEQSIVELSERIRLYKLFCDPYNAKKLSETLLNKHGLPVVYIRQGYLSLSDPTKTLLELIMGRKLRHCGHPVLRWHASNCIARQDAAGNIKLDKDLSKRKIDGMAALVNAIAAAINSDESDGPSVYETRGVLTLF
jgi:phage terminase large subunit-like protein